MKLSITAVDGGATPREIRDRVDGPRGFAYRRTILLDFKTGGQPERIRVNKDATDFNAVFTPGIYDVLSEESPISAVLDTDIGLENGVRVRLDRPWKIHGVEAGEAMRSRFADKQTSVKKREVVDEPEGAQAVVYSKDRPAAIDHGVIAFFRMDGDAEAPGPTAAADNGASLPDEFVSADFAVQWRSSGGDVKALAVDDLASIRIQCFPTGPRMGLTRPYIPGGEGTDEPETFFWQLPGEIRASSAAAKVNAGAGQRLAEALQVQFDAYLEKLRNDAGNAETEPDVPHILRVGLVVESDAPCRLDLDFSIDYALIRETLSIGKSGPFKREKQRLRFPGGAPEMRPIHLQLPDGALVETVWLRAAADFGPSPPLPLKNTAGEPLAPDMSIGASLTTDRRIAFRIEPDAPMTVTAISLGLMAHQSDTELDASLQEDWNDVPSGKNLASANVRIGSAGRPAHHQAALGTRLVLFAQPYWIVVSVAKGAGVWLGSPGDNGSILRLPPPGRDDGVSILKGIDLSCRFLAPLLPNPDGAEPPVTALQDMPFHLLAGDTPLSPASSGEGTFIFSNGDLKNHLNGQLTGGPSPYPLAPGVIPLYFAATLSGIVTIYPPEIAYSLP